MIRYFRSWRHVLLAALGLVVLASFVIAIPVINLIRTQNFDLRQLAAVSGCDNGVPVGGTACQNQGDPHQFRCQPGSRPGASIWSQESCNGGRCSGASCTSAPSTSVATTANKNAGDACDPNFSEPPLGCDGPGPLQCLPCPGSTVRSGQYVCTAGGATAAFTNDCGGPVTSGPAAPAQPPAVGGGTCTPNTRLACGTDGCLPNQQKICQPSGAYGPCVNSVSCGYTGAANGAACSLDSHCQSGFCSPITRTCQHSAAIQDAECSAIRDAGQCLTAAGCSWNGAVCAPAFQIQTLATCTTPCTATECACLSTCNTLSNVRSGQTCGGVRPALVQPPTDTSSKPVVPSTLATPTPTPTPTPTKAPLPQPTKAPATPTPTPTSATGAGSSALTAITATPTPTPAPTKAPLITARPTPTPTANPTPAPSGFGSGLLALSPSPTPTPVSALGKAVVETAPTPTPQGFFNAFTQALTNILPATNPLTRPTPEFLSYSTQREALIRAFASTQYCLSAACNQQRATILASLQTLDDSFGFSCGGVATQTCQAEQQQLEQQNARLAILQQAVDTRLSVQDVTTAYINNTLAPAAEDYVDAEIAYQNCLLNAEDPLDCVVNPTGRQLQDSVRAYRAIESATAACNPIDPLCAAQQAVTSQTRQRINEIRTQAIAQRQEIQANQAAARANEQQLDQQLVTAMSLTPEEFCAYGGECTNGRPTSPLVGQLAGVIETGNTAYFCFTTSSCWLVSPDFPQGRAATLLELVRDYGATLNELFGTPGRSTTTASTFSGVTVVPWYEDLVTFETDPQTGESVPSFLRVCPGLQQSYVEDPESLVGYIQYTTGSLPSADPSYSSFSSTQQQQYLSYLYSNNGLDSSGCTSVALGDADSIANQTLALLQNPNLNLSQPYQALLDDLNNPDLSNAARLQIASQILLGNQASLTSAQRELLQNIIENREFVVTADVGQAIINESLTDFRNQRNEELNQRIAQAAAEQQCSQGLSVDCLAARSNSYWASDPLGPLSGLAQYSPLNPFYAFNLLQESSDLNDAFWDNEPFGSATDSIRNSPFNPLLAVDVGKETVNAALGFPQDLRFRAHAFAQFVVESGAEVNAVGRIAQGTPNQGFFQSSFNFALNNQLQQTYGTSNPYLSDVDFSTEQLNRSLGTLVFTVAGSSPYAFMTQTDIGRTATNYGYYALADITYDSSLYAGRDYYRQQAYESAQNISAADVAALPGQLINTGGAITGLYTLALLPIHGYAANGLRGVGSRIFQEFVVEEASGNLATSGLYQFGNVVGGEEWANAFAVYGETIAENLPDAADVGLQTQTVYESAWSHFQNQTNQTTSGPGNPNIPSGDGRTSAVSNQMIGPLAPPNVNVNFDPLSTMNFALTPLSVITPQSSSIRPTTLAQSIIAMIQQHSTQVSVAQQPQAPPSTVGAQSVGGTGPSRPLTSLTDVQEALNPVLAAVQQAVQPLSPATSYAPPAPQAIAINTPVNVDPVTAIAQVAAVTITTPSATDTTPFVDQVANLVTTVVEQVTSALPAVAPEPEATLTASSLYPTVTTPAALQSLRPSGLAQTEVPAFLNQLNTQNVPITPAANHINVPIGSDANPAHAAWFDLSKIPDENVRLQAELLIKEFANNNPELLQVFRFDGKDVKGVVFVEKLRRPEQREKFESFMSGLMVFTARNGVDFVPRVFISAMPQESVAVNYGSSIVVDAGSPVPFTIISGVATRNPNLGQIVLVSTDQYDAFLSEAYAATNEVPRVGEIWNMFAGNHAHTYFSNPNKALVTYQLWELQTDAVAPTELGAPQLTTATLPFGNLLNRPNQPLLVEGRWLTINADVSGLSRLVASGNDPSGEFSALMDTLYRQLDGMAHTEFGSGAYLLSRRGDAWVLSVLIDSETVRRGDFHRYREAAAAIANQLDRSFDEHLSEAIAQARQQNATSIWDEVSYDLKTVAVIADKNQGVVLHPDGIVQYVNPISGSLLANAETIAKKYRNTAVIIDQNLPVGVQQNIITAPTAIDYTLSTVVERLHTAQSLSEPQLTQLAQALTDLSTLRQSPLFLENMNALEMGNRYQEQRARNTEEGFDTAQRILAEATRLADQMTPEQRAQFNRLFTFGARIYAQTNTSVLQLNNALSLGELYYLQQVLSPEVFQPLLSQFSTNTQQIILNDIPNQATSIDANIYNLLDVRDPQLQQITLSALAVYNALSVTGGNEYATE